MGEKILPHLQVIFYIVSRSIFITGNINITFSTDFLNRRRINLHISFDDNNTNKIGNNIPNKAKRPNKNPYYQSTNHILWCKFHYFILTHCFTIVGITGINMFNPTYQENSIPPKTPNNTNYKVSNGNYNRITNTDIEK